MFDVAQRLVRRLELPVLHPQRGVVALQLFERLQSRSHGRDLFLNSGTARQKRRDQLINTRLKLAGAVWAKAKQIPENSAENQQRDDARPTHEIADFRLNIAN